MQKFCLMFVHSFLLTAAVQAQSHGSFTYQEKTIPLTAYRTRMNGDKRIVIADTKTNGKLYSVTITLRPDVQKSGSIKTDAKHSVTLTISNEDYTDAQNFCFDGGGELQVAPQSGGVAVIGKDLPPGNCFGANKAGDKFSFSVKP